MEKSNFIFDIIDRDLEENKYEKIITRFPPEPNGYLHIGHAKSICLNFGIGEKYNGICNLRFDDTNPTKEENEYVESIKEDVKWLGFKVEENKNLYFASNYFDKMYQFAIQLIKKGKAYVCNLSPDEMREYRGTLTEVGKNSPYRNRSIEENLELFEKMKNGDFEEGKAVLRAKIDMSSPNINLRDPIMYRIQKAHHHRTKDKWCIYPMYDWAHGIEDYLEKVTHSICTLEFEDHKPLYNWFLENLDLEYYAPKQIEFARLNLTSTVMSKRKLKQLVDENIVDDWDDPRMPTISGMRRRGYSANAIKNFAAAIGVSKSNSIVDFEYLEHFVREDLDENAKRVMAVLDPLKVIVINYPEDKVEYLEAKNHPKNPEMGTRLIPFSRELYIEKEDFMENPEPKFFRLFVGAEVRFQHGYYLKCVDFKKDENENIIEVHCTYDPETRGGWIPHRKVKGTLHWVSVKYSEKAQVRLYDKLLLENESENFLDTINKNSLKEIEAYIEPSLKEAKALDKFQFLRNGYFCADKNTSLENPIFNLTVSLKDSKSK